MSENLLPCAHCGGESKLSALQSIIDDRKIADRYYIVCLDCGVQTAMLATIAAAIAAWNRRIDIDFYISLYANTMQPRGKQWSQ